MEVFIYVLLIIVIVAMNATKKAKKDAKKREAGGDGASTHKIDSGRVTPTAVGKNSARASRQKAMQAAGNLGKKARNAAGEWKKSIYEADRDSHYDRESLDYCDSDVPSSEGISFRGLPEGADELAYLRSWNRTRERQLEKSLESRS